MRTMKRYKRNLFLKSGLIALSFLTLGLWHWNSQQIDYSSLEFFLSKYQWEEADQQTSQIIGKILKSEVDAKTFFGYSRLDFLGIKKNQLLNSTGLPCKDLQQLDHLWSKHSEGKFGFTAQAQISFPMESLFSNSGKRRNAIKRFEQALGWRDNSGNLVPRSSVWYEQAESSQNRKGFLPSDRWVRENAPEAPRHNLVDTLKHFRSCTKN
jgi:hypothetical protein